MIRPRILVVEDERIVALHLRQKLISLGYEAPLAVASGEAALGEIEQSRPDLILMDINLEGALDGIEAAARIPPAYHIPVVYLTAYSEDTTLQRACATNPYGYLLKPFSERDLHATIQTALARSRTEAAGRAADASRRHAEKLETVVKMSAGLAHEFNNLLTVIFFNLETLGDQTAGDPEMSEIIETTMVAAVRGETLIRKLMTFSQQQPIAPRDVSIPAFVQHMIPVLKTAVGDAITIAVFLPAGLWTVRADEEEFGRALVNLADNARDAMPGGGCVTITGGHVTIAADDPRAVNGAAVGPYVTLSMTDTGTGMPDPVASRAFEPFFTTKPFGQAVGLGLSQVFGFVRQAGGHVTIENVAHGGTAFTLFLPAVGIASEAMPRQSIVQSRGHT